MMHLSSSVMAAMAAIHDEPQQARSWRDKGAFDHHVLGHAGYKKSAARNPFAALSISEKVLGFI
jgi:hypothetical protein